MSELDVIIALILNAAPIRRYRRCFYIATLCASQLGQRTLESAQFVMMTAETTLKLAIQQG